MAGVNREINKSDELKANSQEELFILSITKNSNYGYIDNLLRMFSKSEDKISVLEKMLDGSSFSGFNRDLQKNIYSLLAKYHDIYAWEKTCFNSKLPNSEKLEIKEEHYKKTIEFYTKAGYEDGNQYEIKRLVGEYTKLANVYEEMGTFRYNDAIRCLKKADELSIKCGIKVLNPKVRKLTEEEKKREIEKSKQPMTIPYNTYP